MRIANWLQRLASRITSRRRRANRIQSRRAEAVWQRCDVGPMADVWKTARC